MLANKLQQCLQCLDLLSFEMMIFSQLPKVKVFALAKIVDVLTCSTELAFTICYPFKYQSPTFLPMRECDPKNAAVESESESLVEKKRSHYNSCYYSDDGFRSGCRNVSQHQQQSFSGLHHKPERSLKPQHNCYCQASSFLIHKKICYAVKTNNT